MNTDNTVDDETPFVREECGDTMWDEDVLNRLTAAITPMQEQPTDTDET